MEKLEKVIIVMEKLLNRSLEININENTQQRLVHNKGLKVII